MDDIKKRFQTIVEKLALDEKKKKIRELEAESSRPAFWQDHKTGALKMKELAVLQKAVAEAEYVRDLIENNMLTEAEELIGKLEILLYFSGEYDEGSAIFAIHSGQGGVEAMDWTEMLYRMYTRFFEKKGWKCEIIDETRGEEAGIKSVVLSVDGNYAYGMLRKEAGVHRLVRQSPFNADKLRQTSFAMVEVMPLIENDTDLAIKDDELDWEFYRASSHGGQNVQKVSSAVRLKHIPTGIIVTAQSERYQGQNREYALKLLRAKLWLLEEERRKKEEQEFKGGYKTPGWGNQIRSYVLHPYRMVKDLRSGYEISNTAAVLDGDLDGFIEAELTM